MPQKIVSIQLHCFADSRKQAYAGVIYLRIKDNVGIRVSLLAARSKVAPLKALTIPTLELLGCLLVVSLLKDVTSSIQSRVAIEKIYSWSDSLVALFWIKGKSKSWKAWVENRVVPADSWFYVESGSNSADIPTRVSNFQQMVDGKWFGGPDFLQKDNFKPVSWDKKDNLELEVVNAEARRPPEVNVSAVVAVAVNESDLDGGGVSKVIDAERYS